MRKAFSCVPSPVMPQCVQDNMALNRCSAKVFHKSAWNIIRMMKFRADVLELVAQLTGQRNFYTVLIENRKGIDHWQDVAVDRRIVCKSM
jgi:hypothetical protein